MATQETRGGLPRQLNIPAAYLETPANGPQARPEDRRQAPRHPLKCIVYVVLHGKTHRGICKDISVIGLGCYGMPAILAGSEVKVRVELAPGMFMEAAAIVVRQAPDINSPENAGLRLITGMRFLPLEPQSLAALHAVLAA